MNEGIFASNLERILFDLCQKSDAGVVPPTEIQQRFDSLRNYGCLPKGRENRAVRLSNHQVAAAVLGLTPLHPNWAGHTAIVLGRFEPVGGAAASLDGSPSLAAALAFLIGSKELRSQMVSLSLSMSEAAPNSDGSALLVMQDGEAVRQISFVSPLAVSSLQPGAEQRFDPVSRMAKAARLLVLKREFLDRLATRIEMEARWSEPAGDGSEYDSDDQRRARLKALGVGTGARFLNIGVNTQATWPREERLIKFDKYHLVMMPKTKDHSTSIHVDLTANKLSEEEAMTVINRLLSVMAWCDDQFAILEDGWSGNPVPVAVPRRDLAFATTHTWVFDRQIPATDEARRALAHYREALNADEASLVSYAVLSYFKVLELRHDGGPKIQRWIEANFELVYLPNSTDHIFLAFEKDRGAEQRGAYLWNSARLATAHASIKHPSDADMSREVRRLRIAARVMRCLARHFILSELGASDSEYSGT